MRKLLVLLMFAALGAVLTPKAEAYEPWGVGIYNGTVEALDYSVPGATLGSKIGRASCRTVMGIVNWGDCSIRAAMKNGRISRVTAADWEKKFIVLYGTKTLRVYGN